MVVARATRCLLVVVPFLLQEVRAATPCVCDFDGSDPLDCKVLGQFPTQGHPILWDLASPKCLEYYQVNTEISVDPSLIDEIWPNGVHAPGNVDLLMAWLQQNETGDNIDRLSRTIKLLDLSYFFRQVYPSSKSPVVLKDRLVQGNQVYDCTANNGESCWILVRNFLTDTSTGEDGEHVEVMEGIGEYLWGRIDKDQQFSQEKLRAQICKDTNAIHAQAAISVCGSLVTQIHDLKEVHGIEDCNTFALGPDMFDKATVPKCNGSDSITLSSPPDDPVAMSESAASQDFAASQNSAAVVALVARLAFSVSAGALAIFFF